MFFGGGSGSYSQSSTKGRSESDFWTKEQKKVAQQLGKWMGGYDLSQGAKKYEGPLAGTATNESLQALFSGAGAYAKGDMKRGPWDAQAPEGSNLFQHYQQWSSPEEREARIGERLESRRAMLGPEQAKQDAAMKAKMRSMGLASSTDALQQEADIAQTRQAEESLIASDLRDRYEQLGFQASESALQSIQQIGGMQKQIEDMGYQAEYDEWLRTQPEYNPMVDLMMKYLGLQGTAKTKSNENTSAWSVSGSAGAMSDERIKMNVVAFEYIPEANQPKGVHLGLIAQEVEKQYPHLVYEVDGVKHINYATLSAILMTELQRRS
jgi:hypothetical protein